VADFKLPPALVSASEANRTFSALLRQVTQGQTFTVLSHRLPVATFAAASATQGGMGASRQALLAGLTTQPASGEFRTWRRDALYD
jgi:antitoxin (DNA-binding transcriptional repressor) of toxin-antitoxin stability system